MLRRIAVAGVLGLTVPGVASAHPGHGHAGHGLHYLIEPQHVLPLGLLVVGGLVAVLLAIAAGRRRGSRR